LKNGVVRHRRFLPITSSMVVDPEPSEVMPVAPSARPAVAVVEPASPLSESDFLLLRQVVAARRPVRQAARVAHISAVTILAVGVLSLPCLLWVPGWLNMGIVFGICVIGLLEYSGAARMRQGVPEAAGMLALNQLALLGLIVIYCLLQMLSFSSEEVTSSLSGMGADIERMAQSLAPLVTYGMYSLIIVLSAFFQGGLAVYYFSRRRHLEAARRSTPAWVGRVLTEVGC